MFEGNHKEHHNNLVRVQDEFNQMMRRLLDEPFATSRSTFMPAVNVKENSHQYTITAELPGLNEQQVDLEVHGNTLIIRGERKTEEEKESDRYHMVESKYGSFQRSFTLPEEADVEKISAEFEHGVLKVHVPKSGTSKAKKIQISRKGH
ncbi:Hsp20/alpha crystallin family protein [Hazenella coriacea]|uniref:HSP20 family protein n=1 Tax=Hazenella coriacea TaxID=1179467 RepID=A0A4R3L1X0_9BACL|nr:Hsp20/alpha crystallin family protein [Hazenella coriacea]TCS93429.1 HSP20 family protein [Hazenella coriacea]